MEEARGLPGTGAVAAAAAVGAATGAAAGAAAGVAAAGVAVAEAEAERNRRNRAYLIKTSTDTPELQYTPPTNRPVPYKRPYKPSSPDTQAARRAEWRGVTTCRTLHFNFLPLHLHLTVCS